MEEYARSKISSSRRTTKGNRDNRNSDVGIAQMGCSGRNIFFNNMKICFVAHNIFPLFSSKGAEKIGGAELQQMFIGKGLRDRGYEISYITHDYGQPEGNITDDLKFYKSFKPDEGIFGVRFFYPRLYKIWRALRRADADVYYVRCAGFLPGIVAIFCSKYRRKFIFAGASDKDFMPKDFKIRISRDRLLYKFGLKRASAIIVQSKEQKRLLWESFRLHGHIISNFFPGEIKQIPDSKKEVILWVSTIRNLKQPFQFIRLSKAFPHEKFVMIGGPDEHDRELYEEVTRQCASLPNIDFIGFQPLEKTENYFDQCKVFINTSLYEGFPNTFLQTWHRGIPVISFVDPDNIIKENRLGTTVESEQGLHNALQFYIDGHFQDADSIIDNYYTLLEKI